VVTNGRVQNEGGDFYIGPTAGPELHFEESTGEVKDHDERQFIRASTNRTAAILIQAQETTGTTDGSGLFSVTFPEAFTTAPTVVVTTRSSSSRIAILNAAPSTTGFTARYIDSTTGSTLNSTSINLSWIAFGSKTDIV